MNKRKIEGAIWFAAGLILVLLLGNKSSMLSDNAGENIFSLYSHHFYNILLSL